MTDAPLTAMVQAGRPERRAPERVIESTAAGLDAGTPTQRARFAARGLRALAGVLHEVAPATLADANGAPSDLDALLRALQDPNVLAAGREQDPLAAARLRGAEAKRRLLAAEGGTLSARDVAALLGISRQAVDKRRRAGRLLGLATGRRGYAYPAWQFADGAVLPGWEPVLADLRDHDPWMRAAFAVNANTWLDGESPLSALRRGRVDAVRLAATQYGEQGAA